MPKKQQSIIASGLQHSAQRPAEFTILGAHTGAQAIICAQNFLEELGFRQKGATCMYQDAPYQVSLPPPVEYRSDPLPIE